MHRHNRHGLGNINLEIDDDSINYIDKNNLNYTKANKENTTSNLGKIDTNKNDISANLIKINSNEDDILYNSTEINFIKINISKSYFKNVYNILFYDVKEQIDFRNNFYNKTFELNAKKMISLR